MVERNILPSPLLYLSAYFESTRDQYYANLRAITEEGNWQRWLEYFLQGVARQAEDAISRSERINKKLSQWRKQVAGSSTKAPILVIDLLAANPFLTIKKVAKELKIAFTTAQRAIEKLEKMSIIKEVTRAKRDLSP